MEREILDQLEFRVTIDITKEIPEDLSNLKEEDIYHITKIGNILELKDGVFPLHVFSFEEKEYIVSAKVEVYWTYFNMREVKQFKLKEVRNILNLPILVNKERIFQINIGKEVLEDIFYRVRFLENLLFAYDMTTWYVIPTTPECISFSPVIDPCSKEHNKGIN